MVSRSANALPFCGFRSTATEMLDDLATELLTGVLPANHLTDPPLTPAMANDQISSAHIAKVMELLLSTLDNEKLLAEWFARYMTSPKYSNWWRKPRAA